MNTRRFLFIAVCAFTTALAMSFVAKHVRLSGRIADHTLSRASKVPALDRSLRPNYPYSVIPGGAYSPAELRFVTQKDPLVRDHYSDFDLHAARLVTLTDDRFQYASFRMKNRIYWTRNKLRIPRGEVLLTDGRYYARTRCGNRLSSTPQRETTALQPSDLLLSLPPYSPKLLPQLPFAEAPPADELAQAFPVLPLRTPMLGPVLPGTMIAPAESWPPLQTVVPIIPITGGYIPTPAKTPTPGSPGSPPVIPPLTPPIISHVPEPASIYLFGVTMCLSLWFLTRRMRRSQDSNRPSQDDET